MRYIPTSLSGLGTSFWPGIVRTTTDTLKRCSLQFFVPVSLDIDHVFKGDDAPKGIHPHFIRKIDKVKVNHSQHTPHPSKEVEDNPEEAAMLAEMIHLITIIVEHHVSFVFRII